MRVDSKQASKGERTIYNRAVARLQEVEYEGKRPAEIVDEEPQSQAQA